MLLAEKATCTHADTFHASAQMPDASEAGGRRRRILTAFYGPHDLRLPVALESERWEQVAGQKEGRKVPTNEQLRELEAPLSSKEQELALGRRVTQMVAQDLRFAFNGKCNRSSVGK